MKNKKLLVVLLVSLMMVALMAVVGCAPAQPGAGGEPAAPASETYPAGSLKAAHVSGQLDDVEEYSNKLCLSCHNRETINKATENLGGTEGYNPHQSHNAAGDCTSCHSVDATSTLTCNSCHSEELPEGWESAERGAGPIHDLSK